MLLLFIVENSRVFDEFDKNHLDVRVIYCVVHGRTSVVCAAALVSIMFDETHHHSTLSDGCHRQFYSHGPLKTLRTVIRRHVPSASLNLDRAIMVCANCYFFNFYYLF